MNWRWIIVISIFLTLILPLVFSCSQNEDEDPPPKDDSLVIHITVRHDDLFGFDLYEKIGRVFFSDSVGLVGSPITVALAIDEIDRFDDNVIDVRLVLENLDAIKTGEFSVDYELNGKDGEFSFIIPQIKTVPTLLNFKLFLTVEDTDSEDYFEATIFYQFFVNQGTPAT